MPLSSRFLLFVFAHIGVASAACPVPEGPLVARTPIALTTPDTLACDFRAERAVRPSPQVGLALSGGGSRAGLFAHGVMQGLFESGLLEKVDTISSVSGGGYAALWYFTKRMEATRQGWDYRQIFADCLPTWWVGDPSRQTGPLTDLQKLIAQAKSWSMACPNSAHFVPGDPYRWQAHLARWPDIFGEFPVVATGSRQSGPWFQLLGMGIEAAFTAIARLQVRSDVGDLYQAGIERTWGLNPVPRRFDGPVNALADRKTKWAYTNDNGNPRRTTVGLAVESANWTALREWLINAPGAPIWVMNARIGNKQHAPHPETIYEMTPFVHGSDRSKYSGTDFPYPGLGTAVRISGAFADYQGLPEGTVSAKLLQRLSAITRNARWSMEMKGEAGQEPYSLSDGGGEENLALYSLVRRGIPNIIAVDASFDAAGGMDDLCRVRRALARDGLVLEIPALEKLQQVCERAGTLAYNTSAWLNPVVKGAVRWPVNPAMGAVAMPDTAIWFIKLGWNQQEYRRAFNASQCENEAHPVSCLLTVYYGHNTTVVDKKDRYMLFPQLSTAGLTLNSSTYLFWAYRELGRSAGRMLAWDGAAGTIAYAAKGECLQAARRYVKGHRAGVLPREPSSDPSCKNGLP